MTLQAKAGQSLTGTMNYVFTEQVGYLLRRAYQRHLAIFQSNAAIENLTAVQFSTLCALDDGVCQSQVELVKATGVDQATIRGIVERLKARGLVTLSKDPDDRRKVIITISDEGRDALRSMTPCAIRSSEDTLDPLNPAERLALLHTLRKIADVGQA
ncbi:MarR family winged helix-turn-helix transcriptional regulator [Jiella pelagia]|nr:MarR family winged helix-turn-helix transcriptional regulator [Jiella pelagia]